jgi:hypothetical protein
MARRRPRGAEAVSEPVRVRSGRGEYVAERYASELGDVSCGKSCIRFTKIDKINLETLQKILIDVNTRYAAGEKLYGS